MSVILPPWKAPLLAVSFVLLALMNARSAEPAATDPAPGDTFLRDYAETRGFMLGRPVNATPTPDGKTVLFLRAKSGREPSQSLYAFDVASKETRLLLAPEDALKGANELLSPEEKARRERQRISVGGFTAFGISKDSGLVLLSLSGKIYVLDLTKGGVRELATGEGTIIDPKFSPDSRSVAYVRNQDVCVFDLASGKEHAVTTGGTETVSHGLAEFVAQEEMARFAGYWWSPDSRQIVYQESDASKVEVWYAADPAQPGRAPEKTFYPRPGKANVAVRLGVVAADGTGNTTWLDWDHAKYEYLGKVTWGEHGPLTLTVMSRDQTDLALLKAEAETGKTSVLLTEHDDAWVNLPQDVPVWLSEQDGGGFLWASEQSGWRGLEQRTVDGNLAKKFGMRWEDNFRTLVGVAGGHAYGIFSERWPFCALLELIQLVPSADSAKYADMATDPGVAQASFGDCKTIFTDTEQTSKRMPHTLVRQVSDGTVIGELPGVAAEPSFTPETTLDEVVPATASGPESMQDDYFAMLVRPRQFDPAAKRKYPVIVDVYGGPGHQQVLASMRPYLLDQWLANQGFIVVAIDGRGTPGRGRDWERAMAGHFGTVPLDDQVEALKLLGAKHPEMDLDRVGITGWSFGGYMSALAVLRRPDVFKAAVAGAPVTDWMDYDTCYTERYLGVSGAGRWPDAYREGSLDSGTERLTRPLLLIHGTADDNVYFRHSLKLIEALFRSGQRVDFLPLDSFTHMVPDPVVRTRLEERIVDYFRTHLGTPSE